MLASIEASALVQGFWKRSNGLSTLRFPCGRGVGLRAETLRIDYTRFALTASDSGQKVYVHQANRHATLLELFSTWLLLRHLVRKGGPSTSKLFTVPGR